MKMKSASLALVILTSSCVLGLPPKQERVHEQKLSDKQHEVEGEHNEDYDHDAFLGEKEAREFDDLSPEESKERLGYIVEKIDKNKDGKVTEDELQQWIQYVQKKYVMEDTERMWADHDKGDDNKVTWESYRKRTFGYEHEPDEDEQFSEMVTRDKRKFDQANQDRDSGLSKEEFAAFLHPEEYEHMKDIVVMETMEDIDKDKDGFISEEEYIADIYDNDEEDDDEENDDEEDNPQGKGSHPPEWVESERLQFQNYRDRNHDKKLDLEEVRDWVMPQDYDTSKSEAAHLVRSCDEDQDGVLTKEEILNKYDVFVGSQATDFGDALTRHDEF